MGEIEAGNSEKVIYPYTDVTNEGNMIEQSKIKISSKEFRVTPGTKIKFREWPTTRDAFL